MLLTAACCAVAVQAAGLPGYQTTQYGVLLQYDTRHEDRVAELVRAATAALATPGRRDEAELPVKLLGRLKAERAVPFLVGHLAFRSRTADRPGGLLGFGTRYPFAAALAQIGGPAVNRVVAAAEKTDDALFHWLASVILVRALGADLATEYLTRRAAKLPAGDARRRVDAVHARLKSAVSMAESPSERGEGWLPQDMPKP